MFPAVRYKCVEMMLTFIQTGEVLATRVEHGRCLIERLKRIYSVKNLATIEQILSTATKLSGFQPLT